MSHKKAVIWTFLAKWATGHTKQCEICHEAFPGTFMKTQVGPIKRTKQGPCLGNKKAMV